MRIAQIAPPWITVPPSGYGGTEWVVQQLCDGLSQRGHKVVLYASGDSHTEAELRALFPAQLPELMGESAPDIRHVLFSLRDIARQSPPFDLIHDHSGVLVPAFGRMLLAGEGVTPPPILHAVHCAFKPHMYEFYEDFGRAVSYNAISEYQRSQGPPGMRWAGVVHNAIDLRGWECRAQKDDYLLAFGRICEEKGFHLAIEVARRTGRRLIMGGVLQRQYEDYYYQMIQPELDDQIVYVGEVSDDERRRLFANAAAFLFPILWAEPFGLVMLEAMACGTPVLALRNGSVPEVVEGGRNGFIAEDVDGLIEAVGRIGEIDPGACRESVERRFTVDRLLDEYEALYRKLLAEEPSGAQPRRGPAAGVIE